MWGNQASGTTEGAWGTFDSRQGLCPLLVPQSGPVQRYNVEKQLSPPNFALIPACFPFAPALYIWSARGPAAQDLLSVNIKMQVLKFCKISLFTLPVTPDKHLRKLKNAWIYSRRLSISRYSCRQTRSHHSFHLSVLLHPSLCMLPLYGRFTPTYLPVSTYMKKKKKKRTTSKCKTTRTLFKAVETLRKFESGGISLTWNTTSHAYSVESKCNQNTWLWWCDIRKAVSWKSNQNANPDCGGRCPHELNPSIVSNGAYTLTGIKEIDLETSRGWKK